MANDHDLFAELKRHNLLLPLLQQRTIAEAVANETPDSDKLNQARTAYLQRNGLKGDEELKAFLAAKGWDEDDFLWQIGLPLRITSHCEKHFRPKAEAHFLTRKNQLDQVVYSLLRTKDPYLAQELYLRIDSGEANFADLAANFAEGPERETKGIVGPVPLTQAHPALAEKLRTSTPGVLQQPFKLTDWWLVLRLERYTPASFDERMAAQLSQELFNQWVNEEASRKMAALFGSGAATTAA